ncbi:MAG: hypothetical protein ACHRHE_15220 [Tepidisphaerales bacterium]
MKTIKQMVRYAKVTEEQLIQAAQAEQIEPAGERDGQPVYTPEAEVKIFAAATTMFAEPIRTTAMPFEISQLKHK